jgi:hypothetical protein
VLKRLYFGRNFKGREQNSRFAHLACAFGKNGRKVPLWLCALVVLYAALAPYAPSSFHSSAPSSLEAESGPIQSALGLSPDEIWGAICQHTGYLPPSPADQKQPSDDHGCPVCQLIHHAVFDQPPSGIGELTRYFAAASFPVSSSIAFKKPLDGAVGGPRAPPALV